MSFLEMVYRIFQKVHSIYVLFLIRNKKLVYTYISGGNKIFPLIFIKPPCNLREYPIFNKSIDVYENIDWSVDIQSGRKFPQKYAKKVDTRNNNFGDAKYVWEVNRLQFLVPIALKYMETKEKKYLDLFVKHISNWSIKNPYLIGVNWYNNIEVNIRLIVWMCCWDVLDVNKLKNENADFNTFVENTWIPLIYLHCVYSFRNPSLFSSANNHRIAELAGLYIASSYWQFRESQKWKKYSQKRLEEEIVKQHYPSGANKEEASEYIQFITDFFLLSYLVGEKSKDPFSENYKTYLKNIIEFIYYSTDINCNHLKYGDEDEGYVLRFDYGEGCNNFRSLLLSGYILFGEEKYLERVNYIDNKNKFLFGEKADRAWNIEYKADKKFDLKEYNGHFFLRSYKNNKEILFHLNAAPLGYLSLAAHGHADALSFTLNYDGIPVFIDPGTYLYYNQPDFRKYFKSTLAHNTIRINKQNQADYLGSMLWSKHYKTHSKIIKKYPKLILWSSHSGYDSLKIHHEREIEFDMVNSEIMIIDTIVNDHKKGIEVEIPIHLHPLVEIEKTDRNQFELKLKNNSGLQLRIDNRLTPAVIKGGKDPKLGWYSESFGKIEPTNTILAKFDVKDTTKFYTNIAFGEN